MAGDAHHAHHAHHGPERMRERQRLRLDLAEAWWALAGGRPGLRVADVGCGPGVFTLRYAAWTGPSGSVLAVDVDEESLDLLRGDAPPWMRVLRLDAAREPLPERVEVAFVTDALHHVDDPLAALRLLRARAERLLVAEFSPDAPGDLGPPLAQRLAPGRLGAMLREAGWAPGPALPQGHEHYAILAE